MSVENLDRSQKLYMSFLFSFLGLTILPVSNIKSLHFPPYVHWEKIWHQSYEFVWTSWAVFWHIFLLYVADYYWTIWDTLLHQPNTHVHTSSFKTGQIQNLFSSCMWNKRPVLKWQEFLSLKGYKGYFHLFLISRSTSS
jgi:hypothetical protein